MRKRIIGTQEYAGKEKAITKALDDLKANFYCELCDKQYYKHQEFDNHINSYDHAHKQRLKELKQREFARNVASKLRKDEKKQEKALKRLHELAELRKQVGCAPGSGPMFKSTTVAVKNPPGKNPQLANQGTEGAESKLTDIECMIAGSTMETNRAKSKLPASSTADMWKAEHCKLGKQISGQKVGFSFSFPKKVPVKLESSAAVFCENSEEGTSKKNTIHKHKIDSQTCNTQRGSGLETIDDLESSRHLQQNHGCINGATLFKEVHQDLVIKDYDSGVAETNTSCESKIQCKTKLKLNLLVSVPSTEQDTLQKEEKATRDHFSPDEGKSEGMTEGRQGINILIEGETSTLSDEATQNVNAIEESLYSLPKNYCSEKVATQIADMQNNPCLCRRPGAPFLPVVSKDDSTVLQWPSEMIHFTNTQPSITFSCNPLYFDFRSSKSKGCVEEIKSQVNDLEAPQISQKEPSTSSVNVKRDRPKSCSDMKLNSPSSNPQDGICSDEMYHVIQKSDLDIYNELAVGLKHHYDGNEQEASIREILSYCKPKKIKKHRRSSRHLKHKRRKRRAVERLVKNGKGESKQTHFCKMMERRKVIAEWSNSEMAEDANSSGTVELSDEEQVTDSAECRPGHGKVRTEDSEGSPSHLEVKFDQSNESSEKFDGFWKNIDCGIPKRYTLKNKCDDSTGNTNNEEEGKRVNNEDYRECHDFLTENEAIGIKPQKQGSLENNSAGDSSSNTCLHKIKQRNNGNSYNYFSDVEYSDGPSGEGHSCQNHSKKRGYASLNGEAVIICRKRCRHKYSSSHRDDLPYRCWSQRGSTGTDFDHKSRKETRQQEQRCQVQNSFASRTSGRERGTSSDGLLPCYPSSQENTCEVSAPNVPGKAENALSITPIATEEHNSLVAKPSTGSVVEDYPPKTSNQVPDRPVSKLTKCNRHELDKHTEDSLSEMWINHKGSKGNILFPRLSFVPDDNTVLPHSQEAHDHGLPQKDTIAQKQVDSRADNIKDVKASLNEVFLCHYETTTEGHVERTWFQDHSKIPHCNAQQVLQNDAKPLIDSQPQRLEQTPKPFSPLSQTISYAPEEIEKYRRLQIQAQQHIEQQKLDSKVKESPPAAAVPMQHPVSRQQSVATSSITTIHRTVLQHHPASAATMVAGPFIQPLLQSVPQAHPLPPHLAHVSLTPTLYPGGPPTFLAAPQLHIIPACALHPDHVALHPLPAAALFPPLFTLHTPAVPLHHFLHSNFTTQDFLHLTGAPT
ncbi:zinc finger protein 804A-like [Narcine bancroftii]|uniref:zinc finger protein 804A-like n=1 Tax=Narcine bancroftii TaxID=1343680 RepID=UPI003831F44B